MKMQTETGRTKIAALLVCGLLLGGATSAMRAQDNTGSTTAAQPAPGGPGGHRGHGDPAQMEQRRLDMMTKHLNLTPDQVTQVKAIMDDSHAQMTALRNNGAAANGPVNDAAPNSGPTPNQRAKMMSIRQTEQTKIRAVLTDDQKSKFDAMQAQAREHRQNGGNDGPPPPPPTQQ